MSTDLRREPPPDVLEESAEDLYENAPCGYVSTRPDGVIVRVNATLLTWTGYSREELVGKRALSQLFAIGGRIYYETHFAPLLAMQGFVNEVAMDIVCADGRLLPVLINSVQRRDASGRPTFARTSIFDVTDRKKYEREIVAARKQAEAASKAKSDFVSMISHEIRTPLNAIMGVAHLLSSTELSPQQAKYLRILRSSSENLLALINDILDFSKIEAGKVSLERRAFDLREAVYGIAYSLGVKADEKKIALSVTIDGRVPPLVYGDPVKLGQILTNLVGNAIKFTSRGGVTICVDVTASAATAVDLRVAVKDTGIGIARDRLATIFDDFTQASYDIGVRYGGTGLGLAIVRRLVALHGSRIEVESTPGEGSRFFFDVRVDVPPLGTVATESSEREDDVGLEGLRALVADDNEVNVFVLAGMLRRWRVALDVATNGREAVEKVSSGDYDVVLMDLRMPEMDGYDAARAIRKLEGARARIPLIAVSASTRIGAFDEIRKAGFDEFVGKPVSPDALADALRRTTGRAR